jgi:4-amino-4-deoxy-L-arabinose transferase-like glycosyltransferase
VLIAFYLFSKYFELRRIRWLFPTGLVMGLACLTRIVGLSVVASFALALLLLETNWRYILSDQSSVAVKHLSFSWRRFFSKEAGLPIREIALILVSSLPLILIWMIYTFVITDGVGNRSLLWHPIGLMTLLQGLKNMFNWLVPQKLVSAKPIFQRLFYIFSLVLFPGLLSIVFLEIRRRLRTTHEQLNNRAESSLAFSLAIYLLIYVLFLVVSISLFDASTPLNTRILSVITVPLIILFAAGLARVWQYVARYQDKARWAIQGVMVVFCFGVVFFGVKDGLTAINRLGQDGLGFASRYLTDSKAIQMIRQMPPITIYTDKPNIIRTYAVEQKKTENLVVWRAYARQTTKFSVILWLTA